MSGGHFNYDQYKIERIAEDVEQLIVENPTAEDYERFTEATIKEFKVGLRYLRMAAVYAQRIDWLVSGDDGEDSFHRRLAADLAAINGFNQTFEHLEHAFARLAIRVAALEQQHEDDNK